MTLHQRFGRTSLILSETSLARDLDLGWPLSKTNFTCLEGSPIQVRFSQAFWCPLAIQFGSCYDVFVGQTNDFYQFDPNKVSWSSLSINLKGVAPGPRRDFGFACAGIRLYIFGGFFDAGMFFETSKLCGMLSALDFKNGVLHSDAYGVLK